MSQTKRVAVIGAGIVGLSVALWLQRAGVRDVILIDKAPPGGGASFGNAGVMADYARVPFANWAQFKQLPRALLDRSSPVAVRRHYLPPMLRYAAGFARACTPSRFHAGCRALVALQRTAVQDTTTLLQHAGATSLVRDSGVLALSSSRAGLQQALAGHVGLRERLGARAAQLSAAEAAALEPAVADFHAGGIYYPGGRYARDPHELCLRYASQFARAGGRFVRMEVESIQAARHGCTVAGGGRQQACDHVVVCTGAAGARLATTLGLRLPLVSERGYHLMLQADDIALTRPVAWLERSVYLTPMLGGIRVAGVAEFAQPDHPASDELFALLEADAATMLGRRPTVTSRWVGARPSTPDSLPIVGRVPSCKAVSLALGHGHLGLTFAAVTARLVAESVVRGDDTAEMAPFLPARFA